ncbi:MAG: biotin--[acetyl-CoA-carboxylase] ligase [Bacteroidales bacterium]|nr:biotin--[acetyl-CoA-carboxylase] ligase [Bacteroidales bacterium]
MDKKKLHIDQTPSTNTWLMTHCREEDYPNLFTVYTFRQTAGRGQAGNAWESEPGKNLSFSTLVHIYTIEEASRLNLLVPLTVVRVLLKVKGQRSTAQQIVRSAVQERKVMEEFTIKWPNDIYWGDKKVAGLLNENVIIGNRIAYAVAGIGVNVNQEVFRSDAPNPVSLKQITGETYELEPMIDAIVAEMERLLPLLQDYETLKREYMAHLYRKTGFHLYVEREVSTAPTMIARADKTNEEKHTPFLAEIADVDEFGRLVLRTKTGELKTYHFKEIRFVI